MPIGKDSIKKRVAKVAETEAPATEEIAAKAPAKKAASTAKKAATPKKKAAPKTEAKAVTEPATAVMGNVAPETVEKVVGHAEKAPVEHVQIGHKMPTHLL